MSPQYNDVDVSPQVPKTRQTVPAAAAPAPDPLVPLTTDIPASIRKSLKLACAIHDVKLKDAVAQALTAWLAAHPTGL